MGMRLGGGNQTGFTSGPGGAPPPYSSDEPNPFSFMPYKAEEPAPPSKAEEGWGKKKKKGEKNKIAQTPRTGKDAENQGGQSDQSTSGQANLPPSIKDRLNNL